MHFYRFKRTLENSPIINNKCKAEYSVEITKSPMAQVTELTSKVNMEKTCMILDDLETIDVSPETTPKSVQSVNNVKSYDRIDTKMSVQSSKSRKTNSKPIDSKNTKPITSFFTSKFSYEKTNKMSRLNL